MRYFVFLFFYGATLMAADGPVLLSKQLSQSSVPMGPRHKCEIFADTIKSTRQFGPAGVVSLVPAAPVGDLAPMIDQAGKGTIETVTYPHPKVGATSTLYQAYPDSGQTVLLSSGDGLGTKTNKSPYARALVQLLDAACP